MNLTETEQEATFRAQVRDYLATTITPLVSPTMSLKERLETDRLLSEAGYLGYAWPTEFGGRGGNPVFTTILDEECSAVGIPRSASPSRFGANLLAPALMAHATADQLEELLPGIRECTTVWCQGFSETEAGSDLANVQSFATDAGDHLVLNGTKIWTTQAHEADWCFALVRTSRDAPRHHNLSFVLFAMDQPGVTISPIEQLTGEAEFNELHFQDVRVEKRHVVGKVNEGWRVAITVLGAERSYGQLSRYRDYVRQLEVVSTLIARSTGDARATWLQQFGQLHADLTGIRDLSYKLTSLAAAEESVGSLPSVIKLWWSRTHQRLLDLAYEVSVANDTDLGYWQTEWLRSRAESIYAGTSEVQRNIIAERMLGLPK